MSLSFNLEEVPFARRTIKLDPEYGQKVLAGKAHAARDYYDVQGQEAEDLGVEPGVYMMTQGCHNLIYLTMHVGMPRITEKNWKTFYARLYAWERITGACRFLRDDKGISRPLYFTAEEIRGFIGLGTNASKFTDAQWRKELVSLVTRNCEREIRDLEKKQSVDG